MTTLVPIVIEKTGREAMARMAMAAAARAAPERGFTLRGRTPSKVTETSIP